MSNLITGLKVALAFTVITIVAEYSHLFALVQGMGVNIALVLCFAIIGLKIQMRLK